MLRIVTAGALVALLLAVMPPAAAEVENQWDGCIQYAYVADYHWYWICVAPRDTSCPVYTKERHGMTYYRECVVERPTFDTQAVQFCIPTNGGGLDYHSHLCVDTSDLRCPVYHESASDWGVRRTCVPPG